MGSVPNPPKPSRTLYQQSYITNLPQSSIQFPQPMIEIFRSSYSDSEKIFCNVPFNWPGVGQKSSAIFRSISPNNDRNLPQSSVQLSQTLKKIFCNVPFNWPGEGQKSSAIFRSIYPEYDWNLPQSSVQFTQDSEKNFCNVPFNWPGVGQKSSAIFCTISPANDRNLPQSSVQFTQTLKKTSAMFRSIGQE